MKLYTQTGTRKTTREAKERDIGLMISNHWYDPGKWSGFAVDNGCYSAYAQNIDWDPSTFLRHLSKYKRLGLTPDFIVCPDIVASADSLNFSLLWNPVLKKLYPDYPQYLAVQDGMSGDVHCIKDMLECGIFSGIFVGGTMEWKLLTMKTWVDMAHDVSAKCHVGRIGPVSRMVEARTKGVDSIDSTTWVQRRNALPRYVDAYNQQQNIKEVYE